jgi:NAD(P)-dependent dehydrogenase (short-subunit alcohol dehydrogenase family)
MDEPVTTEAGSAGRLAGKSGIITGAAGGIGAAAVREFVAQGAFVGVLDRPGAAMTGLITELGERAIALPADVTDESDVEAALHLWSQRHQHADFLYICAGTQLHGADGPIGAVSLRTWQRTIDTNLTGAFLCIKHTVNLLGAAASGSLILCGSPTGLTMSGAGYTAYSASKAGMMSLARTVAADYASQGIRANVIVPGTTVTPLTQRLIDDPTTRDGLLAGTPIGRLGTPEDLTGIAVFLASDESRYATGATFCVDGGMTQR